MDLNRSLPKNPEGTLERSQILKDLMAIVDLDRGYLSEVQGKGNSKVQLLTCLVRNASDPLPQMVHPLVTRLGRQHPDFKIKVYTQSQLETALAWGSLYFVEHGCLGRGLYASPEPETLDLGSLALQPLIERAIKTRETEMRKVGIFANTAKDLIGSGDLAMATFNMHQAFELAFRFIQRMGMGHCKVTHSLISHINHTKEYFPTLEPFRELSGAEANALLMRLEHSYSGARYGDDFEIELEQAQKIQVELDRFLGEIESIFTEQLDRCLELARKLRPIPTDTKVPTEENALDSDKDGTKDSDSGFENLKYLKAKHFKSFKPGPFPNKCAPTMAAVTEEYLEALQRISRILNLCRLALGSNREEDGIGPKREESIKETLGLVLEMISHYEIELLDTINSWSPGQDP